MIVAIANFVVIVAIAKMSSRLCFAIIAIIAPCVTVLTAAIIVHVVLIAFGVTIVVIVSTVHGVKDV